MSETLNVSTCRKLSINGKVTIPKSLALPKIHYAVSCLAITNEIVKETDKLVLNFLWNRKWPKVKGNVIIPAIEDGGIKVPDFKSIFKANRVSWVKHLLTSKGKWKNILQSLIQTFLLDHFLQTNLSKEDIAYIPISFYQQVLTSWNKTKVQPNNPIHYTQEKLWDNEYIQTPRETNNKKSIFCPKLYKTGVLRIRNLLDNKF